MTGTPLFLFGTLRHAPLLAAVLGRACETQPAQLEGWSVARSGDGPWPVLVQGGVAEGEVLEASAADLARLDWYESLFGYVRAEGRIVGGAPVAVYHPQTPADGAGPWALADWAAEEGALSIAAAPEIMALAGEMPADEARALFPFLRARAWSQLLAAERPRTIRSEHTRDDIRIDAEHAGYKGFFRLRDVSLQRRGFDGTMSTPYRRAAFVGYDAALVLPYDPVRDLVMLVEQARVGAWFRGDPSPWLLEPIAGLVDAGESPEVCARREAVEEGGIDLQAMEPMGAGYPAPGYVTEYYHMFLGLAALTAGTGQAGLDSENEDIRTHVLPFEQAMDLVGSGEINTLPLGYMMLWLARERERLRAAA